MIAAHDPRRPLRASRLLHVDPTHNRFSDTVAHRIDALFRPGDVLVVNDAATLPASLPLREGLELRLLSAEGGPRWRAVLFGPGDWRTDTDQRPAPPAVATGDVLHLRDGTPITVEGVSPLSPRLLAVRFGATGDALWEVLYRAGRPVQYSYMHDEVPLWAVQNVYAGRPWAVEMPSAGRVLTADVMAKLRRRGVEIHRLTHAAGLSATGDARLDAALPLPERYDIPAQTIQAVQRANRVIAAGTSVVRALEGSGAQPGQGVTDLRITPTFQPQIVDGVLTNMHQPGESHFELLAAFAGTTLLAEAGRHAIAHGYLAHEFGDVMLIA